MPLQHGSWPELLDYIDHHPNSSTRLLPQDVHQGHVYRPELRQPQHEPSIIGAYSFQHSLYCIDREKSDTHETDLLRFLKDKVKLSKTDVQVIYAHGIHLFLQRYKYVYMKPYPRLSKTIYRPELTKEPGVHYARRLWGNSVSAVIDPTLGFLAHIRQRLQKQKPVSSSCLFDSTTRPYFKDFLYSFQKTHEDFLVYTNTRK